MPKLAEELLNKLIPLLEAEYHYNSTLYNACQNKPLTQLMVTPIEEKFRLVAEADALKDKQCLERYLKRFSEELNQQKVLDDFFEELYFGLYDLTEKVKLKHCGFDIGSFPSINYFIQNEREFLLNTIRLIQPFISDFAKTFRRYHRLNYNPESALSAYEITPAYQTEIRKGLDNLMLIYRENHDSVGIQDINNKISILSDKYQCVTTASASISLEEGELLQAFQLRLYRETCYFLYNLLQDAQKLQQERAGLIFTAPLSSTLSVLSDKAVISTPEKLEDRDLKLNKEHLSEPSSTSEKPKDPKDKTSVVVPSKLETSTDIPKLKTSNNEGDLKKSGEQLRSRAKTLTTHFSEKDKEGSNADLKHQKELRFSKPAKKEVPTTDQPKESRKADPILKGLAKRLGKKRYQAPLSDLFYGNLGKVKIEEAVLQDILKLAGGKFDGKREAVRRQLSFKGKLGFVPNSESVVVKAHYHTENQRYASPDILAHYRDFFFRIGLTPHQLWPTQFEKVEYQPTRTTRIYTKTKVK